MLDTTMAPDLLLHGFEQMCRIRTFEETVGRLYRDGDIPGFVHTAIGQEACAVGVCLALAEGDFLTSTHRGHGHCIARGMRLDRMAAELLGRADGYCHGKGGSMHIADPGLGVLGANGIVGAGLPIATGAALVARLRGSGVSVAFFGEGASTTGAFHESLNLAALWELPVLFACENNGYIEFTPWSGVSKAATVSDLVAGYGMEAHTVDGSDVEGVFLTARRLVERLRAGDGPFLIEMNTFRYRGHYEGDFQKYRARADLDRFADLDPLPRTELMLCERGIASPDKIVNIRAAIDDEVADAFRFAAASAQPSLTEVDTDV